MENSKMKKTPKAPRMGGGPMGGMRVGGEKPKDFKGTIKKLIKYLSRYKLSIIAVMIFAALSTIFTIIGPRLLGDATTIIFEGLMNMVKGSEIGIDFAAIQKILVLLVGLYLCSAVFAYMQSWLMTGVTQKVSYNLRKEIETKIHALPLSYYDTRSYGEVLSHVTNDVDTISGSLNQSITQIITSFTTIVGVFAMMVSISWQMSLVALLILPISLVLIMNVVKFSQKFFKNQQKYLGHVNGHIEEMYGSHIIVKAFNGEKASIEEFESLNNQLYNAGWKAQFSSSLMMPIMNFIGNIGYVLVCVLHRNRALLE